MELPGKMTSGFTSTFHITFTPSVTSWSRDADLRLSRASCMESAALMWRGVA